MTPRTAGAASIVVTVLAWEAAARLVASPVFPPCSAVIAALVALARDGQVFTNVAASLAALAIGFGAAAGIGAAVGAAMGVSSRTDDVLGPYLDAGLASPMLVYVPVLVTIGGASRATEAATVFLYAVFAIAAYARAGVRGASAPLIEMARAFGATRAQVFRRVIWPGARPAVVAGLRVGLALAVKGLVTGEMLIASNGVGALIRIYGGRFQPARVLALLLVIVVMTRLATSALATIERRAASLEVA
jgi:NitT/TauT family transport system permease protein